MPVVPMWNRVQYMSDLILSSISTTLTNLAESCMIDNIRVHAADSDMRHNKHSPETLSRLWKVGLETAQKTMHITTQQGMQTAVKPITRRYQTDNFSLHHKRLNAMFHIDQLFSRTTSLTGHTCATVFTDSRYTRVYPMENCNKTEVASALQKFINDVGIPAGLTADLAPKMVGKHTDFMRFVCPHEIQMH